MKGARVVAKGVEAVVVVAVVVVPIQGTECVRTWLIREIKILITIY